VFTGIVEELGTVVAVVATGVGSDAAARVRVEGLLVTSDVSPGDSISVSGVCLTVVDVADGTFTADVMRETLERSALAGTGVGSRVNLERAVTLSTRLGGHLVQGHVDGTGRLTSRERTPQWDVLEFAVPRELARYLVSKGSVAVDGVSLTVVEVRDGDPASFSVSLIPTTLAKTTLGYKQPGDLVNLEVDVMAKYVERLLAGQSHQSSQQGVTA
jgi:riboflavin synthase